MEIATWWHYLVVRTQSVHQTRAIDLLFGFNFKILLSLFPVSFSPKRVIGIHHLRRALTVALTNSEFDLFLGISPGQHSL